MENLLINRGDYRRLRQAALLPFAQNCCARVLDNPAFAPVQAAAQTLREQCTTYNTALHAAENRGRDTVAVKNQAREALLAALDQLAKARWWYRRTQPPWRLERSRNGVYPLSRCVKPRVAAPPPPALIRFHPFDPFNPCFHPATRAVPTTRDGNMD